MKKFIVAYETTSYELGEERFNETRYAVCEASRKEVAAKKVMRMVAGQDSTYNHNWGATGSMVYSRLVFSEVLSNRKIHALKKENEKLVAARITAREKASFGEIPYDEWRKLDFASGVLSEILWAIYHSDK